MSGSNAWTRSRAKMRLFPELMAQCSGEAAAYGKCVAATTTGKQELTKNMCVKEFEALRSCFQSAMNEGLTGVELREGKKGSKVNNIMTALEIILNSQ